MATFNNQATLTYSRGTVLSNLATGEITEMLSVTKTAVVAEYSQGSDVTYAVNIRNGGTAGFTDLTLTDDLGGYTFGTGTVYPLDYVDGSVKLFIDGVLQAAPTVTAGPPLTVTGIDIPGGSTATVLYTATANEYAPPAVGAQIVNTASVSGGGSAGAQATETVTAQAQPELTIEKSVSPTEVAENGTLTYTFEVRNTGNTEAGADDGVTVTDLFDPLLSGITVTYNGAPWASPANYTYDAVTGEFATVAGAITVPAATYTRDEATGVWTAEPGVAVMTVSGTI